MFCERGEEAAARIEALETALGEAVLQIEYLHDKIKETGSGNGVIAHCNALLTTGKETVL